MVKLLLVSVDVGLGPDQAQLLDPEQDHPQRSFQAVPVGRQDPRSLQGRHQSRGGIVGSLGEVVTVVMASENRPGGILHSGRGDITDQVPRGFSGEPVGGLDLHLHLAAAQQAAQQQPRLPAYGDPRNQSPAVESEGPGNRPVALLVAHEDERAGTGENGAVVLLDALDPAPGGDRIGDVHQGDVAPQPRCFGVEILRRAAVQIDDSAPHRSGRGHGQGEAGKLPLPGLEHLQPRLPAGPPVVLELLGVHPGQPVLPQLIQQEF